MQEALSTVTANQRIDMPYPNLSFEGLTDALTVVINLLDKGDLPIIVTYQGRTYRVADVDKSPLNLSKLLRVTTFRINKSASESTLIETNEDLLEVGVI